MGLRKRLLNGALVRRRVIEFPADDGEAAVRIEFRGLTGEQRAEILGIQSGADAPAERYRLLYPALFFCGAYDPDNGQRLWADEEDETAAKEIMLLPNEVIERGAEAVLELSGLGKKVEADLAKNSSAATASGDSTSA